MEHIRTVVDSLASLLSAQEGVEVYLLNKLQSEEPDLVKGVDAATCSLADTVVTVNHNVVTVYLTIHEADLQGILSNDNLQSLVAKQPDGIAFFGITSPEDPEIVGAKLLRSTSRTTWWERSGTVGLPFKLRQLVYRLLDE